MADWENMFDFALEIILHSALHRAEDRRVGGTDINQRIIIIHLDHATELLMKSFLIKNDYIIQEIDWNKLKSKGIKKGSKIEEEFFKKDRTLMFSDCLNIIFSEIVLEEDDKNKINKFHTLRNKIQHRPIGLPLDKDEEISNFVPVLKRFYLKMFPEFKGKIERLLFPEL